MPTSSRLFFALWPDNCASDQLARLAQRFHGDYGGRQMARESLHITLVFLGDTLDSRITELQNIASRIATQSFALTLNHAGTWPGGIFWLAPEESPPALTTLVTALHGDLQAGGFSFDGKRFAPHLTLLRKFAVRPAAMPIAPIEFMVTDFVLVRTLPAPKGVRYEVLRRFPLLPQ